MAARQVNSDNKLYDVLLELKRHMMSCRECGMSRKVDDPYLMCRQGIFLVLRAAHYSDVVAKLRIEARRDGTPTVYPCPKLSAHGKTYEQTAMPMVAVAYQGMMF